MKQHISKSQLDELTDEQLDKLNSWYNKQPYEYVVVGMDITGMTTTTTKSPLLSIGQMIEFLEENNSIDLIRKSPIGNEWIINHPTTFGVEYIDKELCNCLWEAVKEVLGE